MTTRELLRPSMVAVVALGGAAGALARYGLSQAFPDPTAGFPWTVLTVNVVGCLLLALLPGLPVARRHAHLAPLLGTGVLGGFTTLSTYAEQSRALVAGGHTWIAAGYVVGTLGACLLAVDVGSRLVARRPAGPAEEDREP